MRNSPVRTREEAFTELGTPTKGSDIISLAVGNEENENPIAKKAKTDMTPIKRSSFEMIGDYDSDHPDHQADMASDCGASEASSSVSALRGWLSDFGNKQKDNLPKKASKFQAPAKSLCIRPDARATDPRCAVQNPARPRSAVNNPARPRSAVKKPAPLRSAITSPSTKPHRSTITSPSIKPPRSTITSPSIKPPRSAITSPLTKPMKLIREPVSFAATTLVQRMTTDKPKPDHKKHFNPIHAKPKIKQEEVQATDGGYASVARLSAWLAEDPTSKNKLRHVRRGKNVIYKSRMFEKGLENVIVEEAKIERGAVADRKNFFKSAFHHQEEEEHGFAQLKHTNINNRYAKSEVGGYRDTVAAALRGADRKSFVSSDRKSFVSSARSEIVVDDAASSLSVSDKKDWLKKAFTKAEGTPSKRTFSSPVPSKARSDFMPSCRSNDRRDDMAASAKRKFLERSARKLVEKQGEAPVKETSREERCTEVPSHSSRGAIMDNSGPEMQPDSEDVISPRSEEREERTAPPADTPKSSSIVELGTQGMEDKMAVDFRAVRELAPAADTSRPSPIVEVGHHGVEDKMAVDFRAARELAPAADTSKPSSIVELGPQVVEDKTAVDFRAARELIVNRSKNNGNVVQVINKVYLRKEKFEKIEKDIRRKSGAFGLLKSSWGESNPSTGRPSGLYTKSYVPDIAPKKSFEELP